MERETSKSPFAAVTAFVVLRALASLAFVILLLCWLLAAAGAHIRYVVPLKSNYIEQLYCLDGLE